MSDCFIQKNWGRNSGIATRLPDRNVSGNFASRLGLTIMRIFVAIILAFISTAVLADSTGEQRTAERAPSATDVITGLYNFSRFQQGLLESADLKGNAEVRNLAALRAEEAAKRDKTLKQIQEEIGSEPRGGKTTSVSASLVEPETADGPTYVRTFYASQTPTFLQIVGSRLFLEYEAVLTNGEKLTAGVVVDHASDGSVPRVSVRMSPLGSVLSLAGHLRGALSGQLPEDLFL